MKIDSFNFTTFTNNHFWWRNWAERDSAKYLDYWYLEPNEDSTGGIGFAIRIPIANIGFQLSFFWNADE